MASIGGELEGGGGMAAMQPEGDDGGGGGGAVRAVVVDEKIVKGRWRWCVSKKCLVGP